jgi:hypothetical protein
MVSPMMRHAPAPEGAHGGSPLRFQLGALNKQARSGGGRQ